MMKKLNTKFYFLSITILFLLTTVIAHAVERKKLVFKAGDPSLQDWLLPDIAPSPADNKLTPERAALGKQLFFDARLSGTGQSTCTWCHTPERGWSDGIPTSIRFGGKIMAVASPTIINIGYNRSFMWDGRAPSLEKQGFGGQKQASDINAMSQVKPEVVIARLNKIEGYVQAFKKAYPDEGLTRTSVGKAIASFERTVVSKNSPFDQWVKGDKNAMTPQQINGFKLFIDPKKGNCEICHNKPNFTDDGFHNIGLKEFGEEDHLPGRYKHRKVKIMDGAFKTPTLRDISLTAPYMHDGTLKTLAEVVEHYVKGGEVKTNLSPAFTKANLNVQEKADVVAFLRALTTDHPPFVFPVLPQK